LPFGPESALRRHIGAPLESAANGNGHDRAAQAFGELRIGHGAQKRLVARRPSLFERLLAENSQLKPLLFDRRLVATKSAS